MSPFPLLESSSADYQREIVADSTVLTGQSSQRKKMALRKRFSLLIRRIQDALPEFWSGTSANELGLQRPFSNRMVLALALVSEAGCHSTLIHFSCITLYLGASLTGSSGFWTFGAMIRQFTSYRPLCIFQQCYVSHCWIVSLVMVYEQVSLVLSSAPYS